MPNRFACRAWQIIAGRYVVIQYLGSGTFCHTVQCEDLKGSGTHRFVCVKVSKNTKDIFDQNLWEVGGRRPPACSVFFRVRAHDLILVAVLLSCIHAVWEAIKATSHGV